jgi:hypothetical protein
MTSLAMLRVHAHRAIDAAAGDARLKYITDVAGQQAVYLVKLEQARAYIAAHALDAQAPVPPYIAAEAAAVGMTALDVAQEVVELATSWNDIAGPAIEGARLGGKAAVQAADDEAAINAARDAAIAALAAI